jgi:signal transduction histidine kinase/ActR/RegA family two-component response regulator
MASQRNKASKVSSHYSAGAGVPYQEPVGLDLSSEIRQALLDTTVWRESLEVYSLTTKLAVALTDADGQLIGPYTNPQATWNLLHDRLPRALSKCPFSLSSLKLCTCVSDALTLSDLAMSSDQTGMVHFAVPLMLGEHRLGALIAGQVFDRYPDQLALARVAKMCGLSPDKVWHLARLEYPVKQATLKVYGRLLETLGNTILRTRYNAIVEQRRLAEVTRLNDLLQQRTRELIEADHRKDEFLAILSHELRTPLNAIFGWAQILRRGNSDEETSTNAAQTIERNAKALAQLIEDLLDVSRIISGKLLIDRRPVYVAPIVEAVINAFRPLADAKGVQLEIRLDPEKAIVIGDTNRLHQILTNLLSNALKFTPRLGRIEVRLECKESDVQITVRDTGCGIEAEFLPLIFERFRQADSTNKRSHGGLGLGLSIVRHLVALHEGVVTAESDGKGTGATFVVQLPLISSKFEVPQLAVEEPKGADRASTRLLKGLRVLMVDDEASSREMVARILSEFGVEVTAVASANEALDNLTGKTSNKRPDLLVSDIAMPDKEGCELIREIRALPPELGGKIPAIALSGNAGSEERNRSLSAGFQMHLCKPFQLSELVAMVAHLAASIDKDKPINRPTAKGRN